MLSGGYRVPYTVPQNSSYREAVCFMAVFGGVRGILFDQGTQPLWKLCWRVVKLFKLLMITPVSYFSDHAAVTFHKKKKKKISSFVLGWTVSPADNHSFPRTRLKIKSYKCGESYLVCVLCKFIGRSFSFYFNMHKHFIYEQAGSKTTVTYWRKKKYERM